MRNGPKFFWNKNSGPTRATSMIARTRPRNLKTVKILFTVEARQVPSKNGITDPTTQARITKYGSRSGIALLIAVTM